MSSRDIIQLKIQKRLIEEHLKSTDDRLDRLSGILAKKKADHPSKLPYDENGITSVGRTVADFRIPSRTIKATAHPTADISYGQATAISNERILTIRQQHQMRTNGRQEVNQKLKARELEELRKQKPEKKAPLMKIPESLLPNRYTRGELPCTIEHGTSGKYLSWACPLENLDYEYYLPLFFDGLQCKDKVVGFIARQGIEDMLYASKGHPERIKPIVHSLARPLRNALAKFDTEILLGVLKALEQLILCNEGIGEVITLSPVNFKANLTSTNYANVHPRYFYHTADSFSCLLPTLWIRIATLAMPWTLVSADKMTSARRSARYSSSWKNTAAPRLCNTLSFPSHYVSHNSTPYHIVF